MPPSDPIEQLFEKSAREYRVEPRPHNWRRLQSHLGSKRRRYSWVRNLAAALLLGLVALVAWRLQSTDDSPLTQQAEVVELLSPASTAVHESRLPPPTAYNAFEEGSAERILVARNVRRPTLRVAPAHRLDT